jgi:type I restriction enzyme M protein
LLLYQIFFNKLFIQKIILGEIMTDKMNQTPKSETITENIFRDFYGVKTFLEKSAISKDYGFTSKKGTGYKGYPDFLKDTDEFLIVVECKASIKDHELAENEVKHYISNVSKNYNVIGIAVSGQNTQELKITHFINVKGNKSPENINIKNLLKLDDLDIVYSDKSSKINYGNLINYADKLNTVFDTKFKIAVHKRPFFFAALLFSFDRINNFLNNYKTEKFKVFNEKTNKTEELSFNDSTVTDSIKVDFLNNLISDGVAEKFIGKLNNKFKTIDVPAKFQFIKTDNKNINSSDYIKFLTDFSNIFRTYKSTVKYYDIVGTFYSEFLRYVQKAGGQDIVLTPDHVKTLMCELLNLQQDSVVLDTCAGSGGFGAVAYGFIDRKLKENGNYSHANAEKIKEKQIIGIEKDEDMFALAFSNMILHGDGKSNLYKGNSFDNFEVELNDDGKSIRLEDKIKELQPNKALMNPPYNDDAAPSFILRLAQLLKIAGNGTRTACIIAPSNCLKKKTEITKEIFKIAKLNTVIDMNVGLFTSQKISAKTSIFIFEVGEKHTGETYFYDFKDDGYKYSERRMEDLGSFKERKENLLNNIKERIVIDNLSYKEKIDEENFENSIYLSKNFAELTNYDFIKTVLNYSMFELYETLNKLQGE